MLVQEADQGLMDVRHFTLAYDYIMLNYARSEGKFAWEQYEQERVIGEHAQYYAYESGAEVIMTREEETGDRVEKTGTGEPRNSVDRTVDWTGRSIIGMECEARDNGKAETIKSSMNKLEETGMGANEHKKTPDWDSPAEGIQAGEKAGEQDVD